MMELPKDFYKSHEFVTLAADVMFVSGIPFLVTKSRGIKFFTGEFVPTCRVAYLAKCLRKVLYLYAKGGFLVNVCLMDREFEAVKEHLPLVELNITAAREHVPEIEREIRQIKTKTRAYASERDYKYIPTLLLIHTVYTAIFWLNAFASGTDNYGIAPRTIVTRIPTNFRRDCKVASGEYVEVEYADVITNTQKPRTYPCLAFEPSGYRQGTTKCLDILTNKVVHRRVIRHLPMPLDIRGKVEALGKRSAKAIKKGSLQFLNRKGEKFSWDNDE